MVYSQGKLQSYLKLRNFQNPFNKDKSVDLYKTYHAQKRPKICTCCRETEANFTYIQPSYITVLKQPKHGLGLMKLLKNYEHIQN